MQADQDAQPTEQHHEICPEVHAIVGLQIKLLNDFEIQNTNCNQAYPRIDLDNDGINKVSEAANAYQAHHPAEEKGNCQHQDLEQYPFEGGGQTIVEEINDQPACSEHGDTQRGHAYEHGRNAEHTARIHGIFACRPEFSYNERRNFRHGFMWCRHFFSQPVIPASKFINGGWLCR